MYIVTPYYTVVSSAVAVNVPSDKDDLEGLAPVIHQASATSGKCVCGWVSLCLCDYMSDSALLCIIRSSKLPQSQ